MTVDNSTTEPVPLPLPRSLEQRRADALDRLGTSHQMWLATAGKNDGPHLIPVAYIWNTNALTTATFERSRTVANLRTIPRARVAIGDTADLIMIDAAASFIPVDAIDPAAADRYAQVSHDPRSMPGFIYIQLVPQRIQVWNGFHEFTERTVMAEGRWLDRPID
ncbi:general stress protein 26 [Nocardia tenerifensis]|uniref:General stress protein 26 n=1 Tax=Nocardia tenerifensis TaxID=228006 RepID=A0A318JMT4_9NOCA|nr:pyridoxamine 5'-phosphate oxidase family protein [Nocardia tenerifensis]PXX55608.1 general stress protein 26 [Nocardia tenerifensis]